MLGRSRRLEPLHLPLSSSHRLMRIFGPVVLILSRLMVGRQTQIPESRAVRPQFVGDNGRGRKSLLLQKLSHQLQCGLPVSSCLDQDVQNLALTIDGPSQVHFLALDRDKHLVQMPPAIGAWSEAAYRSGVSGAELQNPAPNALIGNIKATLGEKILDITKTQRETAIQPNRMLDDGRRKPVAFVGNLVHPSRLPG